MLALLDDEAGGGEGRVGATVPPAVWEALANTLNIKAEEDGEGRL